MTAAQQTVLDEVTEKIREHFDAAVLIVEMDAGNDADPTLEHLTYRTKGTFSQGLGLLEYARHKMLTEEE